MIVTSIDSKRHGTYEEELAPRASFYRFAVNGVSDRFSSGVCRRSHRRALIHSSRQRRYHGHSIINPRVRTRTWTYHPRVRNLYSVSSPQLSRNVIRNESGNKYLVRLFRKSLFKRVFVFNITKKLELW